LQENTEFPVTECYGARIINNDKENKNELQRKEGGKEATEKFVHNGRGGWRGRKDTQEKPSAMS
jgi:hypothetical protein